MSDLNSLMMQYFQWYIDPDLILWQDLQNKAQEVTSSEKIKG